MQERKEIGIYLHWLNSLTWKEAREIITVTLIDPDSWCGGDRHIEGPRSDSLAMDASAIAGAPGM